MGHTGRGKVVRLPSLHGADPVRSQRPTLCYAEALSNMRRCSSRWRCRSSSEPAASAATGSRSSSSAFAEISSLVRSATMPVRVLSCSAQTLRDDSGRLGYCLGVVACGEDVTSAALAVPRGRVGVASGRGTTAVSIWLLPRLILAAAVLHALRQGEGVDAGHARRSAEGSAGPSGAAPRSGRVR